MRGYLAEHIEASTEDHMQLLLVSLSDAKHQLKSLPALEKKVQRLEREIKYQKEEISQLKGEIARGRKKVIIPTRKQQGKAKVVETRLKRPSKDTSSDDTSDDLFS